MENFSLSFLQVLLSGVEITCLEDLVDSWFWTNGFTAVPEARTGAQGMPHIKIPYREGKKYGGRGIICRGVCTKKCIVFALSAFFLCKETLRLKTFSFVLFYYQPEFWFNAHFCRKGAQCLGSFYLFYAFISLPAEGSSKTLKLDWKSQGTPDPAAACLSQENIWVSNKYERP